MGVFNYLKGSGIIRYTDPLYKYTIARQVLKKYRKEAEDIAGNMHPTCRKIVHKVNNLGDTFENLEDSIVNGVPRAVISSEETNLERGDHLFVQRFGYTHHGLYIGNGKVIHYLLECVREDTLEIFSDGAKIHKKSESESPIRYPRERVVRRAYGRYSENKYNLLINNCESFVRWCRAGGEEY